MGQTSSGISTWGGQKQKISNEVFGNGGVFDQFLAGKPNAGFDRAQANAIQGIERSNAANGLANSPLGTRRVDDFRIRSTQGAGDNFLQQLQGFMQPLGSKSNSAGVWGGKG